MNNKDGFSKVKKKRVAIVTLTHVQNYGNRLQNYALQRTLEGFGVEVETIFNNIYGTRVELVGGIKRYIKRIFRYKYTCFDRRKDRFDLFNKLYIKKSKYIANRCKIRKTVNSYYDLFIAGSDQIWNYKYHYSPFFFLQFADKEKRYTYAASIGVDKIEESKKDTYSKWLNDLKSVSVRERNAVDLIRDISGVIAYHVVDPTLLLSRDEWIQFEKCPAYFQESKKNIVVYFLGEIPETVKKEIESLKKKNYEIIYLESDYKPDGKVISDKFYASDPNEFIYLINHSDYVLTDSYHGTIFSIIFEKQFYVFGRIMNDDNNMESRIESLLKDYHLEERFNPKDFVYDNEIDYTGVEDAIEHKKNESISYLRGCTQ